MKEFESLVNTEGSKTAEKINLANACLRVLLIQKEVKRVVPGTVYPFCLRVLLIQKEVKQVKINNKTYNGLRVLLIQKEVKQSYHEKQSR